MYIPVRDKDSPLLLPLHSAHVILVYHSVVTESETEKYLETNACAHVNTLCVHLCYLHAVCVCLCYCNR